MAFAHFGLYIYIYNLKFRILVLKLLLVFKRIKTNFQVPIKPKEMRVKLHESTIKITWHFGFICKICTNFVIQKWPNNTKPTQCLFVPNTFTNHNHIYYHVPGIYIVYDLFVLGCHRLHSPPSLFFFSFFLFLSSTHELHIDPSWLCKNEL